MSELRQWMFATQALWELFRYDTATAVFGFGGVHRTLRRVSDATNCARLDLEGALCAAVETAVCLYWGRVRCLQRSVVTVRLLRKYGIPAELVIGYTMAPFFGHAWVEVKGRVLNGPPSLPQKLAILERA